MHILPSLLSEDSPEGSWEGCLIKIKEHLLYSESETFLKTLPTDTALGPAELKASKSFSEGAEEKNKSLRIFEELLKAYQEYPSQFTLQRFYGFLFERKLAPFLDQGRQGRWAQLKPVLNEAYKTCFTQTHRVPKSLLDVGCGTGTYTDNLRKEWGVEAHGVTVNDLCPQAQAHAVLFYNFKPLAFKMGAETPRESQQTFDLILCIDSLCEINSDQDNYLADALKNNEADYIEDLLIGHYGIVHKIKNWIKFLGPEGRIFFSEPIYYPLLVKSMVNCLQKHCQVEVNCYPALYIQTSHLLDTQKQAWVLGISDKNLNAHLSPITFSPV